MSDERPFPDVCQADLDAAEAICSRLKKGDIIRPECCQDPGCNYKCNTLPFHLNYQDYLDVIWLCSKCYLKYQLRIKYDAQSQIYMNLKDKENNG